MKESNQIFILILIYSQRDAIKYAERLGIGIIEHDQFVLKRLPSIHIKDLCLPRSHEHSIVGKITEVESCDRFWFQPKSEQETLKKFFEELNSETVRRIAVPFTSDDEIAIGQMVAARNPRDWKLHRAIVVGSDIVEEEKLFEVRRCSPR